MKKRLILVTSPPACGKTYISHQLSCRLRHVVYLDKDTLIPLSNRVFAAGGEPVNRSSAFFEENIRNYEYEVIVNLALEALEYDDLVLINAPFTREVRDNDYIDALEKRLSEKDATLSIIWVDTDVEVCRQRMIARQSERDEWKIAHWDEYVKTRDFSIPTNLLERHTDLHVFKNSSTAEFEASMKRLLEEFERE